MLPHQPSASPTATSPAFRPFDAAKVVAQRCSCRAASRRITRKYSRREMARLQRRECSRLKQMLPSLAHLPSDVGEVSVAMRAGRAQVQSTSQQCAAHGEAGSVTALQMATSPWEGADQLRCCRQGAAFLRIRLRSLDALQKKLDRSEAKRDHVITYSDCCASLLSPNTIIEFGWPTAASEQQDKAQGHFPAHVHFSMITNCHCSERFTFVRHAFLSFR